MQTARQQQQQQQQPPITVATTAGVAAAAATQIEEGNINAETQQTNFNLLWDFFDYRIFGSMSVTLRNLFRVNSTIAPPMAMSMAAGLDAGEQTHGPYASIEAMGAALGLGGGGAATAASGTVGGGRASAAGIPASAYFDGSYGVGIADGHVFAFGFQRQIAQEEKVLAKVLYRMTNKLMTLNDKNMQVNICICIELYKLERSIRNSNQQQQQQPQQKQQQQLEQQLKQLYVYIVYFMTVWYNLRAATAAQALQFRGLSTGLDGIQFH